MQVTKEVNEVIVGAIEFARENKHEYVTAEHILYKCTFIEKVQNAMEKCGADIENKDYRKHRYSRKLQFSASDINSRGTVYGFW